MSSITSKASSNTRVRFLSVGLLSGLLAPATLVATLAAQQSRMTVVHILDSSEGILEEFRSAALAGGLHCLWLDVGQDRAVQCSPERSTEEFPGLVEAVDVKEGRRVVVSAYSNNVSTPHGELNPEVELALTNFQQAIAGNPHVSRMVECSAPDLSLCSTPIN